MRTQTALSFLLGLVVGVGLSVGSVAVLEARKREGQR